MSESTAITATAGDKKRGCNYTVDEDVCIARAYVHVSTDPISGSEQKSMTYYRRIYEYYKMKKPTDALLRPESSIETRVKDIQKQCVRFSACFSSVQKMKRSGVNEDDEIRLATALFNKIKVNHPQEDVGRKFKYLKAWNILRDLPKFAAGGEEQTSAPAPAPASSSPSGESSTEAVRSGGPHSERPVGRKRAKELKAKEEQHNKRIRLAQAALELQKKQVHELEEHNNILLFSNGPGGSDSEYAREFFAMRQKSALEKLRASMEGEDGSVHGMDGLAEVADAAEPAGDGDALR